MGNFASCCFFPSEEANDIQGKQSFDKCRENIIHNQTSKKTAKRKRNVALSIIKKHYNSESFSENEEDTTNNDQDIRLFKAHYKNE